MYHVPEMRLHYPLVNTQSNAAITPTRSYDNTLPSFNELSHQSTINLPFVQRETPNAYANVAQLATSPTQAKSGYYCRYYAVPFPTYPQQPQSPYQQAVLPYATIPNSNFQPSSFPVMAVMPPEVNLMDHSWTPYILTQSCLQSFKTLMILASHVQITLNQ